MTTFYAQETANRRRSRWLLFFNLLICGLLGAALGGLIGSLATPSSNISDSNYGATAPNIYDQCLSYPGNYVDPAAGTAAYDWAVTNPEAFCAPLQSSDTGGTPAVVSGPSGSDIPAPLGGALIGLLIGLLAGLGSSVFAVRFASGFVLSATGAHPVTEADEPVLHNVVTELSIAAGLPKPSVHVIEDSALNAFASGTHREDAHITVTRGLLDKLDREELAGVIGHEMSHIRNLDIRFGLYLAGCVGLLALVGDAAIIGLRGFGRVRIGNNRGGGGIAILVILFFALILALLAKLAATLVCLAADRQRELLADASSVELTRNPAGLERALQALRDDPDPLVDRANSGVQHLFFANPLRRKNARSEGESLFSTHPSLISRINRMRALQNLPPLED